MKNINIKTIIITTAILVLSIQSHADNKRIVIDGAMPTWQMIVSEKATRAGDNSIAHALAEDRKISANNRAVSSRGAMTYGASSLIGGAGAALEGGINGAVATVADANILTLSVVSSPYANHYHDPFAEASRQLAPYYSFFNDFQTSHLGDDLIAIAYNILPILNSEISMRDDFVNTAGYVQDIELDTSTGLLKSFSTTVGFKFERKENDGVVWYEGEDKITRNSERLIIIFNFDGRLAGKK